MKKALLVIVPVLLVGAAWLWFYGRPGYAHYQERRALARAEGFLAKGDYRSASLSARQALRANPSSLAACRVMAELAERAHSPAVLDWRRRMAELVPTLENQLCYAAAALRLQGPPYALAGQLLEELRAAGTNSGDYHALAAELALKQNRFDHALAQFQAAARLDPARESHRLNVAVLELHSTNAAVAAGARASLERFAAGTNLNRVALHWLVADRLERKDLAAAERYSKRLLADPHSGIEERLEHLAILQQQDAPGLTEFLRQTQQQASTNAGSIYAVATWMAGHQLAREASAWLAVCPAALQDQQPVPLAAAECLLAANDAAGLEAGLQGQKWGELEFLRLAFLAEAAARQRQQMGAEARWRASMREARDHLGASSFLLTLATRWHRDQARDDLLWQIAQSSPRQRWALLELERTYTGAGNTRGLSRVYELMAGYDPGNFAARNNFAATCLLLKMNLPRGCEVAREVYLQHPQESIVTSTYAYSLHLQGRTREGVAAFEQLKPESLEDPPVALYYGYLLAALGQTNQAAHFLDLAGSGRFLPEEQALLAEARSRPSKPGVPRPLPSSKAGLPTPAG